MRVQGLPLVRAAVPPDSEFSAQHRQLFQKQGGDRQKAKCNVLGRFPARVAVPLLSAYFIFLSFFQLGTHFGSFLKNSRLCFLHPIPPWFYTECGET